MMVVTLVPLNVGSPTWGPFRVRSFYFTGYRFDGNGEDGAMITVLIGSEDGLYSLQCTDDSPMMGSKASDE